MINWRLGARESPAQPSFADRRQPGDLGLDHPLQPGNFARRRPSILDGGILDAQQGVPNEAREVQNARALQVLGRVREKLTGRDFKSNQELSVSDQVDKLLVQATSVENLCQHYIGWCSFW